MKSSSCVCALHIVRAVVGYVCAIVARNIHQLVATHISVPSDALSIKQVEAYGAQLESHLQEVHQLLQSKSTTSSQVRDRVISLETESLPAFAL